jgi:urease accessory protein
MQVVTKVMGNIGENAGEEGKLDRVLLSSEDRASPHRVCESEHGRRVPISLPRGTELQDGDILAYDGDVAIVAVAAPEDLYMIQGGSDPIEWAVIAYQLGNLHRPVRFLDDALLTPADPMVADVLSRLGVHYEEQKRPFVGRRYGAFSHHHHHHDHEH